MRKSYMGPGVVVGLALVPVLMWAGMLPVEVRLDGYAAGMVSLAQVSGLAGMALFALTLILSTRLSWFEDWFGGMNRVYVWHHIFGGVAFILLLLHPLFSAAAVLPGSLAQAAAVVWPGASGAIFWGWAALSLMIILLVLTFYIRPEYQVWKFLHKFLGVAFFLGGLHAFLIPSDISQNMWLRGYLLSLAGVALAVYGWHSVFNAHKKYAYVVEGVERLNREVFRVQMKPAGEAMTYRAGQFAFFKFIGSGVKPEWHPFSFSSGSDSRQMEVTVKDLGAYTRSLAGVPVGARVRIQGPYGRFDFRKGRCKQQLWLAGGVGVTPFMGMSRDLAREPEGEYRARLVYASRNVEDAFALRELEETSKNVPERLQVTPWYADTQGYVTTTALQEWVRDWKNVSVFMCGPAGMMSALRQQLQAAGVSARDIYTEEFEL